MCLRTDLKLYLKGQLLCISLKQQQQQKKTLNANRSQKWPILALLAVNTISAIFKACALGTRVHHKH